MKRPDVRMPVRVGQFYEASPAVLKQTALEYAAGYQPPKDLGTLLGGVVPHAGWMYSGRTAAKVFAALAAAKPETYVLLGAVHQWFGRKGGAFPSGGWLTPLGELPVDADLASAIVEAGARLDPVFRRRARHGAFHRGPVAVHPGAFAGREDRADRRAAGAGGRRHGRGGRFRRRQGLEARDDRGEHRLDSLRDGLRHAGSRAVVEGDGLDARERPADHKPCGIAEGGGDRRRRRRSTSTPAGPARWPPQRPPPARWAPRPEECSNTPRARRS